jgi:L-serine deaminase
MKTYSADSREYKQLEKYVEMNAEEMAQKLAKLKSAAIQQIVIDTMHKIINSQPVNYAAYSRGISLAAQIRQEQRNKIEQWGDKAYMLSEKQLGVVCREIAQLAAIKVEA